MSAEKTHKIKDLEKNLAESEHERRLLQERLDAARSAAADTKRQAHSLSEQLQHSQHGSAEQEVRKMELEGQLRSANVILKQKQENEEEIIHRLQEVQEVPASHSTPIYIAESHNSGPCFSGEEVNWREGGHVAEAVERGR